MPTDEYADIIKGVVGSTPESRVYAAADRAQIPRDVADDYLKTTQIESGHNIHVRASSKGALGFGQVMPDVRGGSVRTVGGRQFNLANPDENIEAGLRYFHEGGSDPVGRRLHYFGGPGARKQYERTGRIPNISDGNMTAAQYVKATGVSYKPQPQVSAMAEGFDDEYSLLIRDAVSQNPQNPKSELEAASEAMLTPAKPETQTNWSEAPPVYTKPQPQVDWMNPASVKAYVESLGGLQRAARQSDTALASDTQAARRAIDRVQGRKTFDFGSQPPKMVIRDRPDFLFSGPSDDQIKKSIRAQVEREGPQGIRGVPLALHTVSSPQDIERETQTRLDEIKAGQRRAVELTQQGPRFEPRNDRTERFNSNLNDLMEKYAPGVANLPPVIQGLTKAASPGLSLWMPPKYVSPEDRAILAQDNLNPEAPVVGPFTGRETGEIAGTLLSLKAAGTLVETIAAGRALSPAVRTAAIFGLHDAANQAGGALEGKPIDWTSPVMSAVLGGVMGKLEGQDPALIRRVVAYVMPQAGLQAAQGVPSREIVKSAFTNLGFALSGGGRESDRIEPRPDYKGSTVPVETQERLQKGGNEAQRIQPGSGQDGGVVSPGLQGEGNTLRATPESAGAGSSEQPLQSGQEGLESQPVEPLRHVDLQPRTQEGKFDTETPAQAEERRAKVEQASQPEVAAPTGWQGEVFHGTKSDFEQFDLKRAGLSDPGLVGKAVYFTPTREQAESFSTSRRYGKGDSPRVIAAQVGLENPLIITDEVLPDGRRLSDIHRPGITKQTAAAFRKEIIKQGHDGVVFKDESGDVAQVAVFDPSKITIQPKTLTSQPASEPATSQPPSVSPVEGVTAPPIPETDPYFTPERSGNEQAATQDRSIGAQGALAAPQVLPSENVPVRKPPSRILLDDPDAASSRARRLALPADVRGVSVDSPPEPLQPETPKEQSTEKERGLSKTLEAAGLEGERLTYEPETGALSDNRASAEGRQVVDEKGIDGAIEHVLHGEPGINWASTGFAALERMSIERARLRGAGDLESEAAMDAKHAQFRRQFAERSTRLGQGSAGIKAIQDFATEDAPYVANKLSQKGRKRDLSPKEEARITEKGQKLQSVSQRKKINDAAWAEVEGRLGKKAGASEKPKTYRERLDETADTIKLTLKPKIGNFDFGRIGTTGKASERGAARTPSAPLEGDAELLAQYAASRLSKVKDIAELNKELVADFGRELEPHLKAIRQRAYEIQLEARKDELASRETQPVRRKAILSEIQTEINAARKEARASEKERQRQAHDAEAQAEKEYRERTRTASREERIKARAEFEAARRAESQDRSDIASDARIRIKQLREEYKEASKAEKSGWRQSIRAQKEAARTAQLWDTPIRQMANESRARLESGKESLDTFNDLVNVATANLLSAKRGGIARYVPIAPAEFYANLKAEFPDLVTKKNQKAIYKEAYQRTQDATSAARQTAKLRTANIEARKFWDEMGLDVDAQAVLIQRSEILRHQQELRSQMAAEFQRVSRPLWKKVPFEVASGFRALKSSIDAPLGRQGVYYLITHPISVGVPSINATIKGYASLRRGTFRERVADQQKHPDYALAKKAGVDFTDTAGSADPRVQAEELFQSSIAEKIPHVRLSEQGFVLGMNEMRLQAFSRFADAGRAEGYTFESHPEFFEGMAKRVNNATGRGTLTAKQQAFTSGFNQLLYSTRLNVSRVQLLNDLFSPQKYLQADLVTRKIMIGEVVRLALALGAMYGGAKALGVGVTIDPDDPDFGKLRIGKTHYDPTGGEAGTIRFLYRFLRGLTKLTVGAPVADQDNPYNIGKNFARQKLAPVPGAAVNYWAGTDVTGKPQNLKLNASPTVLAQQNILVNAFIPMVVGDFIDAIQEEGWIGAAKATPGLAGFGVQSYVPTPEVSEVRRQADVANQRKRKWKAANPDLDPDDYPDEERRSELSTTAAQLNRRSSEAKKAPSVKERDTILYDMKDTARKILPPRYLSQ